MIGFALAAIIAVTGIVVPEFWKRRKLAKLRPEAEKRERGVVAAVERLRADLERLRADLVTTIWQAEVTCSAITWALIMIVIQLLL